MLDVGSRAVKNIAAEKKSGASGAVFVGQAVTPPGRPVPCSGFLAPSPARGGGRRIERPAPPEDRSAFTNFASGVMTWRLPVDASSPRSPECVKGRSHVHDGPLAFLVPTARRKAGPGRGAAAAAGRRGTGEARGPLRCRGAPALRPCRALPDAD